MSNRNGTEKPAGETSPRKGKRVYRSPAGPHREDTRIRKRPPGWSAMSDWVLVRTKLGRENWARVNCENQAMETYLPRCQLPGNGKLQAVFPGYLFVRPGDRWKKLTNTLGVINIVTVEGRPQYVPRATMQWLKGQQDDEGIFVLPRQRPPEIGEHVEIKHGPWKNTLAIYDGLSPEGRSRVLIEFMGKIVRLEFQWAHHIELLADL
jgi:transcription antitermination factor NusG